MRELTPFGRLVVVLLAAGRRLFLALAYRAAGVGPVAFAIGMAEALEEAASR